MDIIKLQILTDQDELREMLVRKLQPIDYIKTEKPIEFLSDLKESLRTDVSDVVLVSEYYLGDGYKASEIITSEYPYKSVILIEENLNQVNLRRAVTSGASDIISPESSTQELNEAIFRSHSQNLRRQEMLVVSKEQKAEYEGKILTVFSTKGGTGKTFVSINLAVELKKTTGKNVVLFDLDMDYGGDAIALNLPAVYSMANVVNEIRNIDEDLIESYLLTHESGVKVLAANPEPSYNEYVNSEHVDIILRTLQSAYDYVIVDMPGRFMETVNPAFTMANSVLLVTTPEVLTLKNIKSSLLVFKELNYPESKLRIILNKAGSTSISRKDVESTLGYEVYTEIPDDVKGARQSQNEGKPYVISYPRSKTTQGLTQLASLLSTKTDKTDRNGKPKRRWR